MLVFRCTLLFWVSASTCLHALMFKKTLYFSHAGWAAASLFTLCLKCSVWALTHQADSRTSDSLGPPVSVCLPSFFGVSRTVGSSLLDLEAFRPIQHVESAGEPIGERNRSDWLFGFKQISERLERLETEVKKASQRVTKSRRRTQKALLIFHLHLVWSFQYMDIFTTTWPSGMQLSGEWEWCENGRQTPLYFMYVS